MKRTLLLCILAAILAAPAAAGTSGVSPGTSIGTSSGRDLDALLARARALPGFAQRDAVLLCEARLVTVSPGGDLAVRTHQAVWIATRSGLNAYADQRVPWHAGTSTLAVTKLRTWRDGRWWPDAVTISPTAVVETLPYALEYAADYADLRETMLLHDGVELPCLLETEYEIVERAGAQAGADGLWVFARRDPAVVSEFALCVPVGVAVRHVERRGAPAPTVATAHGATTRTWRLEDVPQHGLPAIAVPAADAPSVLWSTWDSWQALGAALSRGFDDDAPLGAALRDTLAARLGNAPDDRSKARAVVKLLEEGVRSVHVDDRPWRAAARRPERTWDTAYGHGSDRAVLAAALFRGAGLTAALRYRARGGRPVDPQVPAAAEFDGPFLEIAGAGLGAFYDPSKGKLTESPSAFAGPLLGGSGLIQRPDGEATVANLFAFDITLAPSDSGGWCGAGSLRTDGLFSAHDRMAGLDGDAQGHLGAVVASVFAGATVAGSNPATFRPEAVTYGFTANVPEDEADDFDRLRLTVGDPLGGLASLLPADVHLYEESRSSAVLLPGSLVQRVRTTLSPGDREFAHLPPDREVVNAAGRFSLRVERDGGRVVVKRELSVAAGEVPPARWPELRALLLEDADPANRTLLLR